jgi:hypothetical protein
MANIIYRTTDTPTIPGASFLKDAPLTNAEIDANMKSLNNHIETVETLATTADDNSLIFAIALG